MPPKGGAGCAVCSGSSHCCCLGLLYLAVNKDKELACFHTAVPAKNAAPCRSAAARFGSAAGRALTAESRVPELLHSQISELQQLSHFRDP